MFKTFSVLIAGTLFLSALFTPAVMSSLLYFIPDLRWPFSRVFDRVAMLAVLFMLWMLRKQIRIGELKNVFNLTDKKSIIKDFSLGLFLTTTSVFLVIPVLVNSGILINAVEIPDTIYTDILEIFMAMTLVSVIEEGFFRVLVFSNLKLKMKLWPAALVTSLIYAFAHFIAPVKTFKFDGFSLTSGFVYLGEIFHRYIQPDIYPAFFGLFIVGMILCYVIQRSNSVYLCIGLHAGWAAGLKFLKHFTDLPPGTVIPDELGGRYFLVAQPFAWLSMLVVFAVLFLILEVLRKKHVN